MSAKLVRIPENKWYRTQKLDDDIVLIDEPWIKPFYRCNMWFLRGSKENLLVDFGLGAVPLRKHVAQLTEKQIIAVATHTHFDHIGAAAEFDNCHVHYNELNILKRPDNTRTLANEFLGDAMFDALPPLPYSHTGYQITAPPKITTLEDGDIINLGNRQLTVIHTPGHSPGGIALWEAKTKTLISGDIIYDGPLIEDTWHSNIDDYIKSMKRLNDLPVRVVHGGHFRSFSGDHLKSLIKGWLNKHGV